MRELAPDILEALADSATHIATCWTITRRDSRVIRLTDSDFPLPVGAFVYQPHGGAERTAVKLTDSLEADNMSISGIYKPDQITETELHAGLYDHAEVEVFLAFANGTTSGTISLCAGHFGDVTMSGDGDGGYKIDLEGLSHALDTSIGEITSAGCRATFGDSRCKANLATWRHTYTLAAVESAKRMTITLPSALPAGSTYAQGKFEVMSGTAAGLEGEIKDWDGASMTLYLPLETAPVAGDSVRLTAGCDHTRDVCYAVFNNVLNFRGEPDIPGNDSLLAPEIA